MKQKLYMVLLGCRPEGRNTEQHDVFFGVAECIAALAAAMQQFWPGVKLHIDAYQSIESVGEYSVSIEDKAGNTTTDDLSLFFINLGSYTPPEFEEYHKKLVVVASDMSEALRVVKQDEFYRRGQSQGDAARSHVDDKFEVDDILNIQTLIPNYRIHLHKRSPGEQPSPNEMAIGYLPFSRLKE